MQERTLTIAEIILIAGTRVALGAGIGLLLSNKFNKDQRNAAGLALVDRLARTTGSDPVPPYALPPGVTPPLHPPSAPWPCTNLNSPPSSRTPPRPPST